MAKTEKKENIKQPSNFQPENSIKKTAKAEEKAKNYSKTFFVILLIACVGIIAYDIKLTKNMNENLAAQLTTDYNTKINVLKNQLQEQEIKLNELKNQEPKIIEKTNTLTAEQLENLAKQVASLLPALTPNQTTENIVKPIGSTVTAPEVLLAAGALIVRDMAEKGLVFDYETEVLQILAQNNETALGYINNIKKYAATGITGRTLLINEFNKVYADLSRPQLQKSSQQKTVETWDQALWRRLKELVVLKKRENKTKIIFPQSPDEIYQLVNNGKFSEALSKIKTDRKYNDINSSELNFWISQAQIYTEFDRAVNGLIMNALANLRLKELERQ